MTMINSLILSLVGLFVFSLIDAFSVSRLKVFHSLQSSLKTDASKEDIPRWAGEGIVSNAVNALICIKPLFNLMKLGARSVLINTAEKNNVPWRERANILRSQASTIQSYHDSIQSPGILYPDYYKREFHAYSDGNLNWNAAYECESATYSMALRIWPKENLTSDVAQARLRRSFIDVLKPYLVKHRNSPYSILDVGCSVGMSTVSLAQAFPRSRSVTGLDLSPYMLAVAKYRQEASIISGEDVEALKKVSWSHQNIENTSYKAGSFNLVSASFLFHELPDVPAENTIKESHRLLKTNGVFAMTDNDPKSEVIQNLPPALFTLMKSTEPWTDQYYRFNIEDTLRKTGFVDVQTYSTDPRHRAIIARKK
jgi:ubiquinone/menaquinone biosynthesis C-methylase UbiE